MAALNQLIMVRFARHILALLAVVAGAAAFQAAPAAAARPLTTRLDAVVRDRKTGKIYVGEPTPLEALEEMGRRLGGALEGLLPK